MLQINLTIKGYNTVLRTWKADVNVSLLELQQLAALLKLAIPVYGIYGVEVIGEMDFSKVNMTKEQFYKILTRGIPFESRSFSNLESWEATKERVAKANNVKELLGGK